MSFSSLDADKANGREPHNQKVDGCMAFQYFLYFFIFVLVIFHVNFCLVYCLLWAFTGLAGIIFTDPDTW